MNLQIAPGVERRLGATLSLVFGGAAILGGLILSALVLMTMTSITGRVLFNSPLSGDFELVEMGTASAVFLMLPYAQFTRGHVMVELFTSRVPRWLRKGLDLFANVIMLCVAVFIAWRTQATLSDKIDNGQVSYLLSIPVWIPFVVATVACYLWALSSLFTVWRAFNEIWRPDDVARPIEVS